ncbi:hypothetical protein [Aliiglaciecola sp. LCG003]|uniref:hypothetical protein n=1 Tax=Aliiglaciecola sp. LCG003 TaxID=3053655 RepID=UPI0025747D9E|nr:hypothetical protein [Aliiglaciecola sp. LCG003]WJG08222.1 hypothetical protein QR722_12835 [Aliiglaciecola sp. LCG003]
MLFWIFVVLSTVLIAALQKTSLPKLIMSATVAVVCYIGVLLFIVTTFSRSHATK